MKKVLKPEEKTMEKIVALCKNRGYVYPGSEIYGGLSNSWDYGPLGCLFKDNVKNAWKRKFVQESRYNVALDSAILMNPEVWVATGHVGGFSDPLMDCKAARPVTVPISSLKTSPANPQTAGRMSRCSSLLPTTTLPARSAAATTLRISASST